MFGNEAVLPRSCLASNGEERCENALCVCFSGKMGVTCENWPMPVYNEPATGRMVFVEVLVVLNFS